MKATKGELMIAGLVFVWLVALLIVVCGCAHTPLTGLAIESGVRTAQMRGWKRVGDSLLPPDVQVPTVEAGDINKILEARVILDELVRTRGRSEYEVALSMRPWLVRLAQFGDGALITGAAAALGWAVDRAVDGGDSGDFRQYNVSADRGGVVQIGNRDGNIARGGGNIAEPPEEEE